MLRSIHVAVLLGISLPITSGCSSRDDRPTGGVDPVGRRTSEVRPGELTAALAGARDGDVLLLQPGEYNAFETSKAVRILGGPDVVIVARDPGDRVVISDIVSGQIFALIGVDLRDVSGAPMSGDLAVENCTGAVVLESIDGAEFRLSGSEQIALRRVRGRLSVSECPNVVALASEFTAAISPAGTAFAIAATDSSIECVDGILLGASSGGESTAAVILTAGAQLRLGVVAGLEVRSGPGSQRPEPIGLGAGLVTADPAVVFDPPQTITREPTLGAVFGPARIGETVVVDVVAPSATSVTWLVAPLAQRRIEAGVTGAIWFDPAIADGLALTSGPATRINIPIPANETLRGAVLLVQGVATSGPTAASVPATVVIR